MSGKLAKTMRYLEVSINQGKIKHDWDELSDDEKKEWIEAADAVERLPG